MSLIRRLRLLFLGALFATALGSLALGIAFTADVLRKGATSRNVQEAAALARALPAGADADAVAQRLLAAFDSGAFRRIRLLDAEGRVRFERQARSVSRAPEGFASWIDLEGRPGLARLESDATGTDSSSGSGSGSPGDRGIGTGSGLGGLAGDAGGRGAVEVVLSTGAMVDALWSHSVRFGGALALLAGVIAAIALGVTGRMARELDRTIAHAESLQLGEYQPVTESGMPELRRLTRAVNAMAVHLRQVFEAHSAQLSLLRMEATRDPLTGLANRSHFLLQLEQLAQRTSRPGEGGLVLLRLLDLAAVNRTLGHPATDAVIRVIAQTLQAYTRRVEGCLVGRLNGSDFALMLPAAGVARETAEALMEVLGAALPSLGSGVAVVAGAVEVGAGVDPASLLKAADAALRRAQAKGAFQVDSGSAAG